MTNENNEVVPAETFETRNMGPQPIAELLQTLGLKAHDLVESSADQLTHKLIGRAIKGRRLTRNSKGIVQRALNKASGKSYLIAELFNYR